MNNILTHSPVNSHLQRKYPCSMPECDKAFILVEHQKRHLLTVHGFREKQEIKCDDPSCDKIYSNVSSMRKHFKQVHRSPKTHDCPQCGEKFTKKPQLKRHLFTHTGDYPQKCNQCDAGFLNLKALLRHQTERHAKSDQKRCPVCSLGFPNWNTMVAHRKSAHPKMYPCTECDKQFYSKGKLKVHVAAHQRKQEEWLLCVQDGCGFKTQTRATLIGHIRRNHGDKNFKCDQCEARFSRQSGLTKHKRIHERIKEPNAPKPRKARKDSGVSKCSVAPLLSGVQLDLEEHRQLLEGQGPRLRVQYSPSNFCGAAAENTSTNTDTESDAGSVRHGGYAF